MPLIRFVHAADLHLDSPFQGLLGVEPRVAEALRQATFGAYEKIVELCISERVDALLVAGDVFDGEDHSLAAQLRFIDGLRRLDDAGIRSFICHGNHDPLDGWEARLDFPDGCHRFGPEVERVPVFAGEPDRVVVSGVSYPTGEVRENLVPGFGTRGAEQFSIGLLHANVGADTGHESYAPCTLEDLEASGRDYWALGHVHTRRVLREGAPAVVYPGNPQGRHPNEAGQRGVYVVEVGDSGEVNLDFRATDLVRWERVEVEIDGLEDEQSLMDASHERMGRALDEAGGRDVVLRLSVVGRGPLHGAAARQGFLDDLRDDLNKTWLARAPFAFCERIIDRTGSEIDREELRKADDFLGEVLRLVESIGADGSQLDELAEELKPLFARPKAARYLRDLAPAGEDLAPLLRAAEEICLDMLHESDSS